ncbi:pantoate--beta-alanine ligase [Bacteriovoracaceae bacterium]|nr:pantoate--beta-alanine ligase [Bacteriovoracaceae bacterium]
MNIIQINSTPDLKKYRNKSNKTIGLVPTMGNLHDGHISLLQESFANNEVSILSIFVNPTQFSVNEDFGDYPRTLESDIQKATELLKKYPKKTLIIFTPSAQDIYPTGFDTVISVPRLNKILEGEFRPTHFDGVSTVVYLLLKIVQPTNAYFGQKDYQQLILIKQMTNDLMLDVEIIGLPIIRERSGLPMSSRNQYLDEPEMQQALTLSKSIDEIALILQESGIETANVLIDKKMNEDKNWNYLCLKNSESLEEINNNSKKLVIIGTYQLGSTRLLDNKVIKL